MPPIDHDEFIRWMELLREGQAGMNARLDKLNGTVGDHTVKIAVLEERGHPAVWGGGVASLLVGFAEGLKWVLGK